MRPEAALFAASVLGLLLLSSGLIASASAVTSYVGHDNEEFDNCNGLSSCRLDNGAIEATMTVSSNISWCPGRGSSEDCTAGVGTYASLQYNPDGKVSFETQNGQYWFQAGIIGQNTSVAGPDCIYYTYQVYNYNSGSWPALPNTLVDDWFYNGVSPGGSCNGQHVANLFSSSSGLNAVWYVQEDTDSSGYINDVCFDVTGGGFSGNSTSAQCVDPETNTGNSGNWYWVRSGTCLCAAGSLGANNTFDHGSGTLTYTSGSTLYARAPPAYYATAEDSNIEYGCLSNSSITISQSFGLTGKC